MPSENKAFDRSKTPDLEGLLRSEFDIVVRLRVPAISVKGIDVIGGKLQKIKIGVSYRPGPRSLMGIDPQVCMPLGRYLKVQPALSTTCDVSEE